MVCSGEMDRLLQCLEAAQASASGKTPVEFPISSPCRKLTNRGPFRRLFQPPLPSLPPWTHGRVSRSLVPVTPGVSMAMEMQGAIPSEWNWCNASCNASRSIRESASGDAPFTPRSFIMRRSRGVMRCVYPDLNHESLHRTALLGRIHVY